jgi:asparagine synthase (glutamine-hydrolysing)
MLDGKFTFVLYDETKDFFMAGRDPIGLCPLYYGQNRDGSLCFASELKALEGLCDNYTIFPPGHVFTSTHGLEQWYTPTWLNQIPMRQTYDDVLPKIRETLTKAVQKRLMSDVPVAFLLSGGLDSSLVCSIVKRLCPDRELHTFSVGIEGSPDLKAAQAVAKHIKTIHHEIHFTVEEALNALDDTIYHIESFE